MTLNQCVRRGRKFRRRKNRGKRRNSLRGNPQLRGVVLRSTVVKPKKPNSANRKVVRVRLTNGTEVTAYVPGEGHNLQEHNTVLVRGGRRPDLPGVRHIVIRGNRDLLGVQVQTRSNKGSSVEEPRRNGRSKYGVRRG